MPFTLNQCNNDNTHNHISNSHSILIVDDEADVLSVIKRLLEEHGFNTCCYAKSNVALEHYKMTSSDHDLIISDLQMPNISGLEFIRKAKGINSNVKAFLMTSNFEMSDLGISSSNNNSYTTLNLMIDEFILKPFSIQELIILIRKHLKTA